MINHIYTPIMTDLHKCMHFLYDVCIFFNCGINKICPNGHIRQAYARAYATAHLN